MLRDLLSHGPIVRVIKSRKGRIDLHCMAMGAGYERRANETYDWEGSKRGAFAIIQHTIAGRGELDYAGTRFALTPGDTMVLSFPHANRYWLAPGESWEYFWIGVQGIEALRIVRAVLDAAGPAIRLATAAVDQLADACLELTGADLAVGRASSAAYRAVMTLYDGVFETSGADATGVSLPIGRSLGYATQYPAGNLSVDRLAEVAQLSRAHFVRKFTSEMGTAPSAYVFEMRMRLVERLLIATDATVGSIAASTGFADGNYLAKAFRRATGLSPREFRVQQHPTRRTRQTAK
jgi:AraC family transcriptional regulator